MTIQKYQTLKINGKTIPYEELKVRPGTATLKANPQVNGKTIYSQDISTKYCEIKVTVRNTEDINKQFEDIARLSFANGNIGTLDTIPLVNIRLENIAERAQQGSTEYTLFCDSIVLI